MEHGGLGVADPAARPLKVVYLSRVRLNPYVRLMADGVHKADAAIRTGISPTFTWRLLLPGRPNVVHMHWIELQYSYRHPPRSQAEWDLQALLVKLNLARHRGTRLFYTVHNLNQHEGLYPDLNEKANRWLFTHADAIHVHDEASAAVVAAQYGRRDHVYVVPHGHYLHAYPNTIDRASARRRLGLPSDSYVYLCLGQARPYKGLEQLITAFMSLDEAGSILVIAGHTESGDYRAQLEKLAGDHANVRLFPDYVADDELQVFFNAADACVFPYRRATTSGAALLAYSFGKPIVAPAIGPFPELVGLAGLPDANGAVATDRGILFHPERDDLGQALKKAQCLSATGARASALATVANRDWTVLGARHAAAYRGDATGD